MFTSLSRNIRPPTVVLKLVPLFFASRKRALRLLFAFLLLVTVTPVRAGEAPHRILVRVNGKKLEAHRDDPSGPAAFDAAAAAAAVRDHRGVVDGEPVIVGGAARGNVAAYILEPY